MRTAIINANDRRVSEIQANDPLVVEIKAAAAKADIIHKDLIVVAQDKLNSMSQDELIELVKECNGKAVKAAKQTLIHVGQTGFVLIALKEKIGHGRFMKEVEFMTEINHRTATNYMLIARHFGNVSNLRGVRDALRYIKDSAAKARRIEDTKAEMASRLAPSPAPPLPMGAVVQDAEVIEPDLIEPEAAQPEIETEQPTPPSAPTISTNSADPYLTILQLLPHLSKEQFQELINTIKTRWLR